MEPPRRSWLPVPSNCPVSLRPLLHTASRSLSLHCALAIQVSPPSPVGRMRLPVAPRRQSSPNYRCKTDPGAFLSLSQFKKNIQKTSEWLPRYPLTGASVSFLPCSKLFHTGAAL